MQLLRIREEQQPGADSMNTAVSQAISAVLTPEREAEILRTFEAQAATALRLRLSTVAERVSRLKRLRASILAHK
ncbi:hypothetical protein ABTB34_20730, partial [Acinetobacter baumannii]